MSTNLKQQKAKELSNYINSQNTIETDTRKDVETTDVDTDKRRQYSIWLGVLAVVLLLIGLTLIIVFATENNNNSNSKTTNVENCDNCNTKYTECSNFIAGNETYNQTLCDMEYTNCTILFNCITSGYTILQFYSPTRTPTTNPTNTPTVNLTINPSQYPSENPTATPTQNPTNTPSVNPSQYPSKSPSTLPSENPSEVPTKSPTKLPTQNPTYSLPVVGEKIEFENGSLTVNEMVTYADNVLDGLLECYIEYDNASLEVKNTSYYDLYDVNLTIGNFIIQSLNTIDLLPENCSDIYAAKIVDIEYDVHFINSSINRYYIVEAYFTEYFDELDVNFTNMTIEQVNDRDNNFTEVNYPTFNTTNNSENITNITYEIDEFQCADYDENGTFIEYVNNSLCTEDNQTIIESFANVNGLNGLYNLNYSNITYENSSNDTRRLFRKKFKKWKKKAKKRIKKTIKRIKNLVNGKIDETFRRKLAYNPTLQSVLKYDNNVIQAGANLGVEAKISFLINFSRLPTIKFKRFKLILGFYLLYDFYFLLDGNLDIAWKIFREQKKVRTSVLGIPIIFTLHAQLKLLLQIKSPLKLSISHGFKKQPFFEIGLELKNKFNFILNGNYDFTPYFKYDLTYKENNENNDTCYRITIIPSAELKVGIILYEFLDIYKIFTFKNKLTLTYPETCNNKKTACQLKQPQMGLSLDINLPIRAGYTFTTLNQLAKLFGLNDFTDIFLLNEIAVVTIPVLNSPVLCIPFKIPILYQLCCGWSIDNPRPTYNPTPSPTIHPTHVPTLSPVPSLIPTKSPTTLPSKMPTNVPSHSTSNPTILPSLTPTITQTLSDNLVSMTLSSLNYPSTSEAFGMACDFDDTVTNSIWCFGGDIDGPLSKNVYSFDGTSFTSKNDLTSNVYGSSSNIISIINGTAYMIHYFGYYYLQSYDISNQLHNPQYSPFPSNLVDLRMTSNNIDTLYFGAGSSNVVYSFNIQSSIWTQLDTPNSRHSFSGIVYADNILTIFGGISVETNKMEYIDFSSQISTFQNTPNSANFPDNYYDFSYVTHGDNIVYIFGGTISSSDVNSIYVYNINDNFQFYLSSATLTQGRPKLSVAIHENTNTIWCFGGEDTNIVEKTFFFLCCLPNDVGSSCSMDGCNPQRTFQLDNINIPSTVDTLSLKWIYTTNVTKSKNDSNLDLLSSSYLGCTSRNSSITCLFNTFSGLTTLDSNGNVTWTFPNTGNYANNIQSVPLMPQNGIVIVNTGDKLYAFDSGVYLWSNDLLINSSSSLLSFWSVGLLLPQYFPILLGDGRFALFDYSIGICWASAYLIDKKTAQIFYTMGPFSSFKELLFISTLDRLPVNNYDTIGSTNASIFSIHTGDIHNRIKHRWNYLFKGNLNTSSLGSTIIIYENSLNILFYGLNENNNSSKYSIYCIRDDLEYLYNLEWTLNINYLNKFGIVLSQNYDLLNYYFWIIDRIENNLYLTNYKIYSNESYSSPEKIKSINLEQLFNMNENGYHLEVLSRGLSGHIENENNSTIEGVIDIDNEKLYSRYTFGNSTSKCIGQLAVVEGAIIVPLADYQSVVALA